MPKLMIVDDHPGVRTLIRELVALASDEVCECGSAEEAIRLAARFGPQCVTMDLSMPGIGGIRAIQSLRASHPGLPVFVVSALDLPDLRRAAREAGAQRYWVKEDLADLRAAVRAVLDRGTANGGSGREHPVRQAQEG